MVKVKIFENLEGRRRVYRGPMTVGTREERGIKRVKGRVGMGKGRTTRLLEV